MTSSPSGARAGGPNDPAQAGRVFAAPDNLSFDPAGNLWVVTDVTSTRLNADAGYTTFQNNGMFFVPTSGQEAGVALQFASAPCEAELAGQAWTPDRRTRQRSAPPRRRVDPPALVRLS